MRADTALTDEDKYLEGILTLHQFNKIRIVGFPFGTLSSPGISFWADYSTRQEFFPYFGADLKSLYVCIVVTLCNSHHSRLINNRLFND